MPGVWCGLKTQPMTTNTTALKTENRFVGIAKTISACAAPVTFSLLMLMAIANLTIWYRLDRVTLCTVLAHLIYSIWKR
jgi:hypothetical protein